VRPNLRCGPGRLPSRFEPLLGLNGLLRDEGPRDEPTLGQINRVYEVLNRKRGLTLDRIHKLHRNLGIPAESLTGP